MINIYFLGKYCTTCFQGPNNEGSSKKGWTSILIHNNISLPKFGYYLHLLSVCCNIVSCMHSTYVTRCMCILFFINYVFVKVYVTEINKGIGDAGSTADLRMRCSAIVCLGLL